MKALDIINNYWTIIVSIASLVFWALWVYFTVKEHGGRIERLEQDTETNSNSIQSIEKKLEGMDGKLDILVEGYKKK